MNEPAARISSPAPTGEPGQTAAPPGVVPWGYRLGIITAIMVFLAFSLAFLRYWDFEAPGSWRWHSTVPIGLMAAFEIALD